MLFSALPDPQGLYDPQNESDLPVALPWSPTSKAAARTPSSPTGSSLWNTSNIAAPRVPSQQR